MENFETVKYDKTILIAYLEVKVKKKRIDNQKKKKNR